MEFKTEGRVTSSPSVSAGIVYFGRYDGNFYAVDSASGQPNGNSPGGERPASPQSISMAAEPASETMPTLRFLPLSPVVWNGGVYFGSGTPTYIALDAATGDLKWKFKLASGPYLAPSQPHRCLSQLPAFLRARCGRGNREWCYQTGAA